MQKSSRKYMPTLVFIALNVAFYVYTSIIGGDFINTNYSVIAYYGQVNYNVMYQGWYWQLITSMFVHVNIVHIFGNMFFLLIFGLRAEGLFSIGEYVSIYMLGGLAGNLLSLLFGPTLIPSAGASGAIFSVFAACAIYVRRSVGQSIMGALLYVFFLLFISAAPNVNNLAHFGGLAVGLIIGYALAASRKAKPAASHHYGYSYSTRILNESR